MKKCMSLVLVIALMLQCSVFAFAAAGEDGEFIPTYTYSALDGTEYGKISHPDVAPNTTRTSVTEARNDGIVDYLGNGEVGITGNNEGDRAQAYPWAAAAYGKYIYIGTSQSTPATGLNLIAQLTGADQQLVAATMKALFNGRLYFNEEDGVQPPSVVVKVNVEDPTDMEIIHEGVQFRAAAVVGDKLYFCGAENKQARPVVWMFEPENNDKATLIFRGASPATYTTMAERQLDAAIRGITNYNGHLAFSYLDNEEVISGKKGSGKIYVLKNNDPAGYSVGDAGENPLESLYEYRSPDVVEIADQADLFDYPCLYYFDSNIGGGIHEMIEFNDYLYVSLVTGTDANGRRPFAVVKAKFDVNKLESAGDELDVEWISVIGDQDKDGAKYTFGIDPARTRSVANNIMVYDGHLYIGEYNDQMYSMSAVVANKDLTVMAKNMKNSINLYRLDENDDAELVMGDPTEMFPEGGLSGRGSGFGEGFDNLGFHTNIYTWQMIEYKDKLYVGTYDNASCLEPIGQFVNGDILHWTVDDWKSQINYILTLLELLSQKNETALFEDAEEAADVVLEAADAVVEELKEEPAIELEPVADEALLTEDQVDELAESLYDGEILSDVVPEETLEDLKEMALEMLAKADELGEKLDEEFLNLYLRWIEKVKEYLNKLDGVDEKVAETVKSVLELLLNEDTAENVEAALYCAKLMTKAVRGFDFYSSEDGIHFDPISIDGFGDPYNYGVRVYGAVNEPDNQWLVIGVANPFYGAQLWKLMEEKPEELTYYSVNRYLEQADGSYELWDSEAFEEFSGVYVEVDPSEYEYDHYAFNADKSTVSGTTFVPETEEEPGLQLDLYFDLETMTVTFLAGEHGKIGDGASYEANYKYGAAFDAAPEVTADKGYEFDYWADAQGNKVTAFPETVTEDATYTAVWKSAGTDVVVTGDTSNVTFYVVVMALAFAGMLAVAGYKIVSKKRNGSR